MKLTLLDKSNFEEPIYFSIYLKNEPYGFSWRNKPDINTEKYVNWPTTSEWQDDLIVDLENAIFYEIASIFVKSSDKYDEYGVTDYEGENLMKLYDNVSAATEEIVRISDADFCGKYKYLIESLESEESFRPFVAKEDLQHLRDEMTELLEYLKSHFHKALEDKKCIVLVGI